MEAYFDIYNVLDRGRKAVAVIADGVYNYRFLISYIGDFEGEPKFVLYWPQFSPEVNGYFLNYNIKIGHFESTGLVEDLNYTVNASRTLAFAPFRYEGENYGEFTPLGWTYDPNSEIVPDYDKGHVPYFISITPIKDAGYADISLSGSQTALAETTGFLAYINPVVAITDWDDNTEVCATVEVHQNQYGWSVDPDMLMNQIRDMYNIGLDQRMYVDVSYVISDYNDAYAIGGYELSGDDIYYPYIKIPFPAIVDNSEEVENIWCVKLDMSSDSWYDALLSMQMYAWIHVGIAVGDMRQQLIGFRTTNIPVTQEMVSVWLAHSNEIVNLEEGYMNNYPRLVNKTVNEIVEVTTRNNSKANIVQPVFFQTHPTGSIVIHPAVSENIAINLDYYKSVVDSFTIQIEGVTFSEIARISSGIVFNIKGNLLPGNTNAGVYYILDDNGDAITNGLYQYEY